MAEIVFDEQKTFEEKEIRIHSFILLFFCMQRFLCLMLVKMKDIG